MDNSEFIAGLVKIISDPNSPLTATVIAINLLFSIGLGGILGNSILI